VRSSKTLIVGSLLMFITAHFSVKTHRYFGQNLHPLRSKPTVFSGHVAELPLLESDEFFLIRSMVNLILPKLAMLS
jgi:hypothetical protein